MYSGVLLTGGMFCEHGELFCLQQSGTQTAWPKGILLIGNDDHRVQHLLYFFAVEPQQAWMLVFRIVEASLCANRFVLTPQGFVKQKAFNCFRSNITITNAAVSRPRHSAASKQSVVFIVFGGRYEGTSVYRTTQ